jgi:prefoldin subunit 5
MYNNCNDEFPEKETYNSTYQYIMKQNKKLEDLINKMQKEIYTLQEKVRLLELKHK